MLWCLHRFIVNYNVYPSSQYTVESHTAMNSLSEPPECPAFTVEGSTQGDWTAASTGTTVTIECAANHVLVGSATLTCQDDGTWSSDTPQCVTIGKVQLANTVS